MKQKSVALNRSPNIWDMWVIVLLFGLFAALSFGASQLSSSYSIGTPVSISLSAKYLPEYALHSVVRMLIALVCSLLFTFTLATLAAKNKTAEKFILPMLDIMESVPVLGYLSITVVVFIQWFPNSLMGAQMAAIFAIFTSQVWNMTLSLYQSLRSLPKELYDTASVFQLNAWMRFWRIEVPYALPSLVWNTMISMSAGWFFVVASEAIIVSNQTILLPGIGSYISLAIQEADLKAIFLAIITMFIVILLYDQLLFRPILSWVEKFKQDNDDVFTPRSWAYQLFAKTRFFRNAFAYGLVKEGMIHFSHFFSNTQILLPLSKRMNAKTPFLKAKSIKKWIGWTSKTLWYIFLSLTLPLAMFFLITFIVRTIQIEEIIRVFGLGAITLLKVMILILLASLLWIPIGVWVGQKPTLRNVFQPLTQFLAAFPINLVYPLAVILILYYDLNVEIWTTPLMILGTQWYILFNVIAGATNIPKDLQWIVNNFHLNAWLQWKRLILPVIFPYYVTGAMAAAAGCWNVSIVTEVLSWGSTTLVATGLGSYITEHTQSGDFPRIALGISVMCCYVVVINRLVWHTLYRLSARYELEAI